MPSLKMLLLELDTVFLLGQALLQNSTVNHVLLNPSTFFTNDRQLNSDDAAPMLRYLSSSSMLRTVTLDHYYFAPEDNRDTTAIFSGQLLMAAAKNQLIESVVLRVRLPVDDFAYFLKSTKARDVSLLEERILDGFVDRSSRLNYNDACHRIVDAFRANQSIETLFLLTTESSGALAEQILDALGSQPALTKLTVQVRPENRPTVELQGIGSLLLRTTTLQTLEIEHTVIDEENCDALFEGLRANQTVTTLRFPGCKFRGIAAHQLIDFVQNSANTGTATTIGSGSIVRHLEMSVFGYMDATFPGMTIREVIPLMLSNSSLESFNMSGGYDFDTEGIFDGLVANVATIRIPKLRFESSGLNANSAQALATFLVKTGTLCDLTVMRIEEECDCAEVLLAALRQNGSLLQVTLQRGFRDESIFNEAQSARVQAYCTRNVMLPKLLATGASKTHGSSEDEARNDATNAPSPPEEQQTQRHSAFEQFPALFVTAQHAPRTALQNVLRGSLTASDQSMGPAI